MDGKCIRKTGCSVKGATVAGYELSSVTGKEGGYGGLRTI